MKSSVIGVITPSSTCVLMISVMRLTGTSTTAAPRTIWMLNTPRNSGARRKLLDTDRSAPITSAMA
jgi:hypothetical protein